MKKLVLAFLCALLLGPSLARAALPAATVWEVRTTGSDTNGGGFVAGSSGTDYSQQNAAQYSLTNGVTNGTTTVATTSAAANMVGNIAYIAGGTGSITAGWYYISAVSVGTSLTVDRATGLTSGTGVTVNIGGALATPNALAPIAVSGNKAYIKGGTYTTASNISFSANWSNGNPFQLIGYTTTRTDKGRATIQGITNSGLSILAGNGYYQNLIIDCNSLPTCTGITNPSQNMLFNNVTVKNYSSYGIYAYMANAYYTSIENVEVTNGTTSSAVGIYAFPASGTTFGFVANNYVHDGIGTGILCATHCFIYNNLVANQSGSTSNGIQGYGAIILSNTVYNAGQDGIADTFASTTILNNIVANNGRYGINNYTGTAVQALPLYDGNAFYSNATANRHFMDDTSNTTTPNGVNPYTNTHDVILSSTPFVNAAAGNFALNSNGGGGAALKQTGVAYSGMLGNSTVGYPDFGAFQSQASSGGAGGSFVFGQ